jgi:hypothetical protein
MKSEEVKSILLSILSDVENNWDNKERETYTISKLLELPWLNDGNDLLYDGFTKKGKRKKGSFHKKLKDAYFGYRHEEITTAEMEHDYYVIHEPFGSKSSPDYLFITPYGLFGIEDKSSKNGKISWNTGSPGENKIVTYFDKIEKKVYLITSNEYGWTKETSKKYEEFKKRILKETKKQFENEFCLLSPIFAKLGYYARPMLTDKNNVKDLYDPKETNVNIILNRYLDNVWEEANNQSTDNSLQIEKNVDSLLMN